jgi:tRNA pseudouridine55 synthase
VNSPAPQRQPRRAVHGVLVLHKPKGMSSTDALVRAKRLYRAEKGGHTGTLDPLASGLLPLCFGAATKFAQASLEADKHYRAVLRLGQTTASADAETPVLQERPVVADLAAVQAACASFVGPLDQVPPMFSALKHEGRALYELARQGIEIERAPRRVHIRHIEVLAFESPLLTVQVHCSKGTYIRTLAEGIGERLGCGAHLAQLQRTGSGPLQLSQAHTLEDLADMDEPARDALLLKPDTLLSDWPRVELAASEAARFLTGLRRRVELPDAAAMRVYGPDLAFLGSAHVKSGELIAQRLLSPIEVAAFAA